jgi:hypothetical protein
MPDWADGFCYAAKQSHLIFGSDRKKPVNSRFVVSCVKHNDRIIVLPATSQDTTDFFHFAADQCYQRHKSYKPPRDSYLCPRYESLPKHALTKIGVLPHPIRIQIAHWLKNRLNP